MSESIRNNELDQLIAELSRFWKNQEDQERIAEVVQTLAKNYDLERKIAGEQEVEDIIKQMAGRLAKAYPSLSTVQTDPGHRLRFEFEQITCLVLPKQLVW